MSLIEWYSVIVVFIGAVPANVYPLLYHLRSPWRSTKVGSALMTKAVSIAALFDVSLLAFITGGFPGFAYIYAAVVTFVAAAITQLLAVMVRTQREGRNRVTPRGEF